MNIFHRVISCMCNITPSGAHIPTSWFGLRSLRYFKSARSFFNFLQHKFQVSSEYNNCTSGSLPDLWILLLIYNKMWCNNRLTSSPVVLPTAKSVGEDEEGVLGEVGRGSSFPLVFNQHFFYLVRSLPSSIRLHHQVYSEC